MYNAVRYIEYKGHLYIYILDKEDYEIAYERQKQWNGATITNQIRNLQQLGERLKETKKQLQEHQIMIKKSMGTTGDRGTKGKYSHQ